MCKNTILKKCLALFFLSAFFALIPLCQGHTETFNTPQENSLEVPVSVELISESESIRPGQPFWVAIRIKMEDSWHSYWKNPGETGMPTSIEWSLPEGYSASPIFWPVPERFDMQSIVGYGYENQAILLTQITPPESLPDTTSVIGASIKWLACSDSTCLPGISDVTLSLPVKGSFPFQNKIGASLIEEAKRNLPEEIRGTLTASRKQDLLEIVLKTTDLKETPVTAHFFPEHPDFIDDQIQATINQKTGDTYVIALKENELSDRKMETIKGILVLKGKNEGQWLKAIDIDTPLSRYSDDSELLSMNDAPVKSVGEVSSESAPTHTFSSGFLFYLFTAFIGGMILNLMPCVLPVISLKIMSFVRMSGKDRSKILFHGLLFSAGVLVSFWALAGLLMTLQAYGHAVGWGFQLQQPAVIAVLSVIILVFGLSMFGLFEVGTSFASWAGQTQVNAKKKSGESAIGSFFSGVLATAMATPCTGPFLGPAVGFAVTQPPVLGLLIFTSLGMGMAFPYLLLSAFPSLLRFMPKPGDWMVTFREITGFIMMAVVLWLLWVFEAQTGGPALFILLAGLLFFSIGCWIYGKWGGALSRSYRVRVIGTVTALFCFLGAGSIVYQSVAESSQEEVQVWERFDPARIADLQAAGIPVFVDFTAKWCLICQTNHSVFSGEKVSSKMKELGVVKMKADWTKYDSQITSELKKHGRNAVPLYLLYNGKEADSPEVLPQILTPDIVINYLNNVVTPVSQE